VPEVENSTHVGQAPGVDRLVVVADHEQVLLGQGQGPNQLELGGIHVLELVHREVAETSLPPGPKRRVILQQCDSPHHQVIEVEGTAGRQQRSKVPQWVRGLWRRWPPLDLPGREDRVELCRLWQRRRLRVPTRCGTAPSSSQQRQPVGEQADRFAGIEQYLPRERMQRAHLDSGCLWDVRDEAG
jgi:hypothetical protein